MIQACIHHSAIIVKSQQWPTPRESLAIYLRKETSLVCYTSAVLHTSRQMKQKEKLRTAAKIKTQDYKFDPNSNPSTKHSYKIVWQTQS